MQDFKSNIYTFFSMMVSALVKLIRLFSTSLSFEAKERKNERGHNLFVPMLVFAGKLEKETGDRILFFLKSSLPEFYIKVIPDRLG